VKHALLPEAIAGGLRTCGAGWGSLDIRFDQTEELIVVAGYTKADKLKLPTAVEWLKGHYSAHTSVTMSSGVWYRADPELHLAGIETYRRSAGLDIGYFRDHVKGWRFPPADGAGWFVITLATTGAGDTDYAGWVVARDGAVPFPVEVVPEEGADLFAPLGDAWPRRAIAGKLVTLIGAGSIGGAAAEALSGYAMRQLALVDPDRLHSHNFARHRTNQNQVGRMKVNALADLLAERDRGLKVERFPLGVIEHADVMRPLFARSNCILVSSDGIASRRAANHLACRARVPIVLACVLEDGRLGEMIRVRPGITACLLCSREQLAASGRINPEPSLDLGYGEGHRHLAMAAVGGDLDVVGRLAARAVVSTLLEDEGYLSERLPGDHGVVGLRPAIDRDPEEPFDVERTLQVSWHSLGQPLGDCPSCGGAR
jgi:molybdopterin-synthase adenylyltransferase